MVNGTWRKDANREAAHGARKDEKRKRQGASSKKKTSATRALTRRKRLEREATIITYHETHVWEGWAQIKNGQERQGRGKRGVRAGARATEAANGEADARDTLARVDNIYEDAVRAATRRAHRTDAGEATHRHTCVSHNCPTPLRSSIARKFQAYTSQRDTQRATQQGRATGKERRRDLVTGELRARETALPGVKAKGTK